MSFEVSQHMLVPEHKKLTEDEKKDLLMLYNITTKELPKIFKDDSALTNFDVKADDVIKITRKSPTSGTAVYYRVVIRG